MSTPGLRRVLGLPAVIFIAVGFTIGGGVFVFTGIVLEIAGAGLPVAYALAVLPVLAAMLPLASLGSALPTTGGSYLYPSRMVSPGLAFVGVWVYALAAFFGQIPLYALGCARYLRGLVPELPEVPVALGIVTLFYVANLLGVRLAARLQALLVLTMFSALGWYVVHGLDALDPVLLSDPLGAGASGLLLGTGLLTFTYLGANGVIELGGEIVDPGRTIPRAILVALPLVAVVYVAVAVATVGAGPVDTLLGEAEPLLAVASRTLGQGGQVFFITAGAVLALTTTLNALFMVGTRSLLVVVGDRLLPAGLGRLHPRFGTPHRLLTLVWGLSILGVLSNLSLETLASYAALGGMLIFLPIQIAALRLPTLCPEAWRAASFRLGRPLLWATALVAIALVAFFTLVILVDLGSWLEIAGFVGFIATGVVWFALRRAQLAREGVVVAELVGRFEDHGSGSSQ